MTELSMRLENTSFGILVVTPDNTVAPWLIFEAGALSKDLKQGRVIPYLIGVEVNELLGPLGQFQAIPANQGGTLRLVRAINSIAPAPAPEDVFVQRFSAFWPDLEQCLNAIADQVAETVPQSEAPADLQSDENPVILKLQDELLETKDMIRQLVAVWAPPTVGAIQKSDSEAAVTEGLLSKLEGAWYDPESKTHAYAKIVRGELHAPYCYGGDDVLTAIYYAFRRIGDYWFARFSWFAAELSGFAFYRLKSENELEGAWYLDGDPDGEILDTQAISPESLERGNSASWQRLPQRELPSWAEEYFLAIEKDSPVQVWRRLSGEN